MVACALIGLSRITNDFLNFWSRSAVDKTRICFSSQQLDKLSLTNYIICKQIDAVSHLALPVQKRVGAHSTILFTDVLQTSNLSLAKKLKRNCKSYQRAPPIWTIS